MDIARSPRPGSGQRRRTSILAVLTVLGLVGLVMGAGAYGWATAGPRIEDHGFDESSAGVVLAGPVAGPATLTMALGPLCLDGPGSVEIVDVTSYRAVNGLRVTDFGLVDPVVIGDMTTSVIENRRSTFDDALAGREVTRTLTTACVGDETLPDLVVELRKPSAEDARALGFHVHYRSAGRVHRTFVGFGMLFCEPRGRKFCRSA